MKKLRKFIISGVLSILAMNFLMAQNFVDAKSVVNQKYYDELVKNGVVTIINDEGKNQLELLPDSVYSSKIKSNLVKKDAKNYPFNYESLYYKSKTELLKTSNSASKNIDINDISRICRSVSKMEGMKYYSSTRKKEVVLYETAYMLDGPDGVKIDDVNTGNADGQVSYCMQDDNSFGVCQYKLNYYQSEKEMMAVFTNISTIGLGPFKAIYPECMTINILVLDCGENILFYICCDLDSVKFPGIKAQITDSMTSRMDAIYNWFIKQF